MFSRSSAINSSLNFYSKSGKVVKRFYKIFLIMFLADDTKVSKNITWSQKFQCRNVLTINIIALF